MTNELEKLLSEIKNKKIREILSAGEQGPVQKSFIDPAIETLAREVIRIEGACYDDKAN